MAAALGTVRGQIVIDTNQAKAQLQGFQNKVAGATKKSREGFNAVTGAAKLLGPVIAAAGAASVAALGAKAVKATSEFRSQLNQAGTVAGATTEQMQRMQETALRLGKDTSFSAGQAAGAFLELARSGFNAEQAIEGVNAVVTLAAAATTDMATAAEISSDLMTAFGLEASDLENIVNSMAGATLNSAQNFEDLIYSTRYAAPAFANMGWTMEDLATSTAALASAGIKGSQAGTSLRSMFSRLIKPGEEAAETMAVLGINIENSDGTFKSFEETVAHINDKLSNMKGVDRQRVMIELFGLRAMNAASILFNHTGPEIEALGDKVNASGQATKAAAATMEGLGGALKYFQGTMESAMITAVIPMEGAINDLIRGSADLILVLSQKLAGAFETVSTTIQDTIAHFQQFDSIGEALSSVWNDSLNALRDWDEALVEWLGGMDFRQMGMELADKIGGALKAAVETVSEVPLGLGHRLLDMVTGAIDTVGEFLAGGEGTSGLMDAIRTFVTDFMNGFGSAWSEQGTAFGDVLSDLGEQWKDLLLEAVSRIGDALNDARILENITETFNTWASNLGPNTGQSMTTGLATLQTRLSGWFTGLQSDVAGWWTGIQTAWDTAALFWDLASINLEPKWQAFKESIANVFTGLGDVFGNIWDNVVQFVSDNAATWGTNMGETFGTVWSTVLAWWANKAIDFGRGLFEAWSSIITGAISLLQGFLSNTSGDGGTLLTSFTEFAENAWEGFKSALVNAFDASGLEENWSSLVTGIKDSILTHFANLGDVFQTVWGNVVQTVDSNAGTWGTDLGTKFGTVWGTVMSWLATQVVSYANRLFEFWSVVFDSAVNLLSGFLDRSSGEGGTMLTAFRTFAENAWAGFTSAVATAFNVSDLDVEWTKLTTALSDGLSGVVSTMGQVLTEIWTTLSAAWEQNRGAWGDALGENLGSLIGAAASWLVSNTARFAALILEGFTGVLTNALTSFGSWLSGERSYEADTESFSYQFWASLKSSFAASWDAAKPEIMAAFGQLGETARQAIQELPQALQAAWDGLGAWWLGTDGEEGAAKKIGDGLLGMWKQGVQWFIDNDAELGAAVGRVLGTILAQFNPLVIASRFAEIGARIWGGIMNVIARGQQDDAGAQELKQAQSNFMDSLVSSFGEAYLESWHRNVDTLRQKWQVVREQFIEMLRDLFNFEGGVGGLFTGLGTGLAEIGTTVWQSISDGMTAGWGTYGDSIKAPFVSMNESLLQSWDALVTGTNEKLTEMGQAIVTGWETWINLPLAEKIMYLTDMFDPLVQRISTWSEALSGMLSEMGTAMQTMWQTSINDAIMEKIAYLTDMFDPLVERITQWAEDLSGVLIAMGNAMTTLWETFINSAIKSKIDYLTAMFDPMVDRIKEWSGNINTSVTNLGQAMQSAWNQYVNDPMQSLVDQLLRIIDSVRGAVDRVKDYWNEIKSTASRIAESVTDVFTGDDDDDDGRRFRNPFRGHALGTMNSPGGWSWVGERGPELLNLPRGTQVQSAPQSAFTARGGGDTDPVQVTIVTNDGEDSVAAWMAYREYQFAG